MKPYLLDVMHEVSAGCKASDKKGEEAEINHHSRDNFKKYSYSIYTSGLIHRGISLN